MSAIDLGKSKSLLTEFEQIRAEQLALCQSLEDIADSLGGEPDRLKCVQVAQYIGPLVQRGLNFEQNELLPALQKVAVDRKSVV